MALSLEHQLQKLSAPQTDVFDYRNRKKSILFSDKKAPLIDKETFYDIGLSGITELKEIDSQFNKFDELFDSKAKYFQRSVISKEENLALDEKIEKFLLIVSPYLEKQSALKAIEWLIHRFMINEMHVDAIMMCIFPYYESVLFTRIAQVVNFNQHKQWRWLKSCAEGGRPLANLTVYTYWQTDTWFRNFLSNYFKKMVKVNSNEQGVKLAGSLLISTQMGGLSLVLQSHETPREQVASICQTLNGMFGCGQRDVLCGMLLLMAQMTSVFELSKDINEIIINKIVKLMNRDPSFLSESLLSLMTLCRGQRLTQLPLSAMATILNGDVAATLQAVTDIATKREVAPFLALYTIGVYEYFLSDQFEQSSDPEAVSEHVEQLFSFLERTHLHQSDATLVISSLLRYFCENDDLWKKDELYEESTQKAWQKVWGAQALRRLALSHPEAFDAAKEAVKSEADGSPKELFKMQNEMLHDATANIEIDTVSQEEPEIAEVKEITEEEMFALILKGGDLPEGADVFLRGVVSSIKLKNVKVPMAHTFWQLQTDSSDKFSTKIQRLIQVVRVIVLLQASGREKTLCLQLLHVILNKLLQTTQNQLRFLTLIFGAEKDENFDFDEAVKLWALKLSTSVIKKWKCRMGSTALPMGPWWASVILPLIASETSLPSAAVELLEAVLTTDSADAMSVIKDILKFKEEVVLDCRRLPLALQNSSSNAIAEVVVIAFHKDLPTHTRASMLFLVSEVPVEHFCDHLMTLANQILDKAVISDAESSCLYHILKRFDGDLITKEGSLDLLKKCLESNTQLNVMGNATSPMKLVLTRKVLGYLRLNEEKANMEMCIFVVEILAENVLKGLAGTEEVELLVDVGIHPLIILELWKRFDLVQKYTSIKEARAKRAKLQHEKKNNNSVSTDENHRRWRKLAITVEILAQMAQIEEPWTLVEPLCDHLNLASTLILPFADTLQ